MWSCYASINFKLYMQKCSIFSIIWALISYLERLISHVWISPQSGGASHQRQKCIICKKALFGVFRLEMLHTFLKVGQMGMKSFQNILLSLKNKPQTKGKYFFYDFF